MAPNARVCAAAKAHPLCRAHWLRPGSPRVCCAAHLRAADGGPVPAPGCDCAVCRRSITLESVPVVSTAHMLPLCVGARMLCELAYACEVDCGARNGWACLLPRSATRCNMMQPDATCCNPMQRVAAHCCNTLQYGADMLQHSKTCCNTVRERNGVVNLLPHSGVTTAAFSKRVLQQRIEGTSRLWGTAGNAAAATQ